VDDEGVPSAALPLVAGGVVRNFVYDLETAARADHGAQSTGHGARGIFGKPHIGYSNLVVGVAGGPPPAETRVSRVGSSPASPTAWSWMISSAWGRATSRPARSATRWRWLTASKKARSPGA